MCLEIRTFNVEIHKLSRHEEDFCSSFSFFSCRGLCPAAGIYLAEGQDAGCSGTSDRTDDGRTGSDETSGENRTAYLDWYEAPSRATDNDACMILISGGSYENCCDVGLVRMWREKLTKLGFQCVNLVYRTPRPIGLPFYQLAWEDGQRAVRLVRAQAEKRGFDPEKIGTVSMSAGSHLALLLATSSQTAAYIPVDRKDEIPCHINWAIVHAPAYVTTDAEEGTSALCQGYGPDIRLSEIFHFDDKTCPMTLHHGGEDPYSPNGSTLIYRKLRQLGIPAELHLYPGIGHAALGFDRAIEFMRQLGILGETAPAVKLLDRYPSDEARADYRKMDIWPAGKMPFPSDRQCQPYIEWHFPKTLKTKAIQIIYSGGSYQNNGPESFEVAPVRCYLNEKGMTVVTLKYRTPRPDPATGMAKHRLAWQDLQRAVRLVRHQTASLGLDPERIGIMGSSAGGHLTMMGLTSSVQKAYLPIDEIDQENCQVQWGICIYPAYVLTDGLEGENSRGGNDAQSILAPEFNFDRQTPPTLFIHGDADGYSAMGSVKVWEKMRSMGIQSELHTLAERKHCFQREAVPGTGSYDFMDRIYDFLERQGVFSPVRWFRLLRLR